MTQPPGRLLGDEALEASSVVANSAMNRLRGLDGPNSYTRELGFHPLGRLAELAAAAGTGEVAWLDLCCGSGRALVEAATRAQGPGVAELEDRGGGKRPARPPEANLGRGRLSVVGVDLVDFFEPLPAGGLPGLQLVCASAAAWEPDRVFDLITCVHGLHYVGDKLGLLAKAAGWLTAAGLLVADLEPASVRLGDGGPAGRRLTAALRGAGFMYDARRRRVTLSGRRDVTLPYRYLGADDRAGPNYTGQPAVHSYYDDDDETGPGSS